MRYLADTHLLLWAALSPAKLNKTAKALFRDSGNDILFSTASVWETAVKFARGKKDFTIPPAVLRNGLLTMGYKELLITSEHVIAVAALPTQHGDPFDRLLVAQAMTEGMTLLTADKLLSSYPNTLLV